MTVQKIRVSQLKEWSESPVAAVVKQALKDAIDTHYQARAEYFNWVSAEETQTRRAWHGGAEQSLKDIVELLEGNEVAIEDNLSDYLIKEDDEV